MNFCQNPTCCRLVPIPTAYCTDHTEQSFITYEYSNWGDITGKITEPYDPYARKCAPIPIPEVTSKIYTYQSLLTKNTKIALKVTDTVVNFNSLELRIKFCKDLVCCSTDINNVGLCINHSGQTDMRTDMRLESKYGYLD